MRVRSLPELYQQISGDIQRVCVIPVLGHAYSDTDYLSQLYKPLKSKQHGIQLIELSAWMHLKLLYYVLTDRPKTLLHYHWLEFQDAKSILGMPYKLFFLWLYLTLGGRMLWTVHNLQPHDNRLPALHRIIHRWFAAKAELVHVHSEFAMHEVIRAYAIAEKKIRILAHPPFPATIMPQKEAIRDLNAYFNTAFDSEVPLLLVFGAISEYKGIREIIRQCQDLKSDFNLLIAGYLKKNQQDLDAFINKEASEDKRITYKTGFIPAEMYPALLSAADICIFNHTDILTSGAVEMARSYNKTIVTRDIGAMKELTGTDIHLFSSVDGMKEIIRSLLTTDDKTA